jgi:hypothetical protein
MKRRPVFGELLRTMCHLSLAPVGGPFRVGVAPARVIVVPSFAAKV